MDIVCPGCRRNIPSSTLPEGKAICPYCKTSLESPSDAASAPKAARTPKSPERDLFTDLMSEARRTGSSRAAAPAAASQPQPASAPLPPPPRPRVRRARPGGPENARPHGKARLAIVVGILAVIGTAAFAVVHIRNGIRDDGIRNVLRQVEYDMTSVEQTLADADKKREAKEYSSAIEKYERVVLVANALLKRLREGAPGTVGGKLGEAIRNADAGLSGFAKRAKEALEIPELKYGSKGMVQLDDGTWVTPEQKQKMFEDRMKAAGRTLDEKTGEWLTQDEVMERKGLIQYIGAMGTVQWVTKEDYAKLTAAAAVAAATPATPVTPAPPSTPPATVPKPRATVANFDPASPKWVIDDFETDNITWSNVTWGNNSVNPCSVDIEKQDGSFKLAVSLAGGPKDKSAIVRQIPADFSSRSKLVFDLFNATGEPVKVAVAIETNARPTFYESRWQMLKVDNNEGVKIDLSVGDFKSSATNWTHSTHVNGIESVRMLYILFYTDKPGKVYLDDISALGQ